MSDESSEIALQRVVPKLKEKLLELQKAEHYASMSNHNPERWMEIAIRLANGEPPTRIWRDLKCHYPAIIKIRNQTIGTTEEFREYQASLINVNMSMANDVIQRKLVEMSQEDRELSVDDARFYKEMTAGNSISHGMLKNLEGKADVVVEHKMFKGPEDIEALKQSLLAKKAEEAEMADVEPVIDVGDENGD